MTVHADPWTPSKPTTRLSQVNLFVEDDCQAEAHVVAGHPDTFVATIDVVTMYGSAETLERVLVEALMAVRVAARVGAA